MHNNQDSLRAEIETLLKSAEHLQMIPDRLRHFSSLFLGRPYAREALPSHDQPEELIIRFDAFDCVTFIESVAALTLSHAPADFSAYLQALRYSDEQVSWPSRKHYSSHWLEDNQTRGLLRNIAPAELCNVVTRDLCSLKHYPSMQRALSFLPLSHFCSITGGILNGDLIFFGTCREDLDVSHTGILFPMERELMLRHASRSLGQVCDEPLGGFLERFGETPGLLLARLQCSVAPPVGSVLS